MDKVEFLVYSKDGIPLLRCSSKQARLYLKKGFAEKTGYRELRFKDRATENKLKEVYGYTYHPFFLAEKYKCCVVCGGKDNLTVHHVVPRRHVVLLSPDVKQGICNTLCVCRFCHNVYEKISSQEPIPFEDSSAFVYGWKEHFLETLSPQYLPEGWDIIIKKKESNEP